MGCRCGGGAGSGQTSSDILGYRAFLPSGEVVPPLHEAPFMTERDARNECLLVGGGSARAIRRDPTAV